MKKWFVCFLLLALMLSGCSAKSNESANPQWPTGSVKEEFSGTYAPEAPNMDAALGTDYESITNAPAAQDRKLIRTIRVEAETEDMDSLLTQLNGQIAALGGYIENQNIRGRAQDADRSATLVIRIPAENADAFLSQVQSAANILASTESVSDVTLTYVSIESRLKALEAEQERLLELMEQAMTIDEILQIESRLTDVMYELEAIGSQLLVYDNQINYATITLTLQQVKILTATQEPTVWERIGKGFENSLQAIGNFFTELFVFLVSASPVLILLGAAGIGGVLLWRVRKKKKTPKEPQ